MKVLPETNLNPLQRSVKYIMIDYYEVLSNSKFLSYALITAFALSSAFCYLTISPYLLQIKIGFTPKQFGYTNLLISITLIIISYVNSKLIYHRGIDNLLNNGITLLGIAGGLFLVAGIFHIINLYTILIPLIILVAGCGFIYPNASAGSLSMFDKNAGTAGAIYACIQMLGGSTGSGLVSYLANFADPLQCLGLIIFAQGVIGHFIMKRAIKD
jgi:hypothetical protein